MFLAKVKIAAGAVLAACAAVVLIGLTLAGPLGGRAQGIEPQSPKAQTPAAKAPIVPGTDLTSVSKTDRGISVSQSGAIRLTARGRVLGADGRPVAGAAYRDHTLRRHAARRDGLTP